MQRWLSLLLGAAVIVLAVLLMLKGFSPPKPVAWGHDAGDGGGRGAALATSAVPEPTLAMPDGSILLTELLEPDPRLDSGIGSRMPDDSPVPPLPPTAPRIVRFGVVLISYAGAQVSATGQPPSARTKPDAKDLDTHLATEAQTDFHSAVQRGDAGSGDDVGHMKLGVLELAPEYILFTLPVGGVSQPIDTPRGFWIVKRLE